MRFAAYSNSCNNLNHYVHLLKALERHSFSRRGFKNKKLNYVWPLLWQTHLFLDRHKFKEKYVALQCVTTVCEHPSFCFGFSSTSLVFLCCCVHRFQPAGLVERIQAIAQNVSNMAIRVEQILQNSVVQGRGTAASTIFIRVTGAWFLILFLTTGIVYSGFWQFMLGLNIKCCWERRDLLQQTW